MGRQPRERRFIDPACEAPCIQSRDARGIGTTTAKVKDQRRDTLADPENNPALPLLYDFVAEGVEGSGFSARSGKVAGQLGVKARSGVKEV
jgi:hypothetical protein